MFVLGHLGIALGLAWLASSKARHGLDFRLVLLGAILPDLIDKPLGFALGLEARLWAHTALFVGALLALSALPQVRFLFPLGTGVATHLLLDRLWENPFVLAWPALGTAFPPDGPDFLELLTTPLRDAYVFTGEVIGTIALAAFAWIHGITSWAALRAFLRDGRAPQPATAT